MPTYVYGPKGGKCDQRTCEMCAGHFEVVQRMSDDALSVCPKCGAEVERLILPPNLNGVGMMGRRPSDNRMSQAGFTQYKKHGKGYYEKSFGQGPSTLHGD
jgi:putative FmdB family regulatory protein